MAVEVRQMIVKSNVVQRQEPEDFVVSGLTLQDKKALLEACRQLIQDALREAKER